MSFLASCLMTVTLGFSREEIPALYNQTSLQQYELAQNELAGVYFKGNETILDVGCGDGKITYEIARKVPFGKVYGIDASEEMISYASAYYQASNLIFLNQKAEDCNIAEEFDYIISLSAFLWFNEPKKAFNHLTKKLKKGGKLIIVTPTKESCDWVYYEKALDDPRWKSFKSKSAYKNMLFANDYINLAVFNRLFVQKFEMKRYHYQQRNLEEFKKYVKSWLFCYVDLPNDLIDDYLDILAIEGQCQFTFSNEGDLLIPYDALTIEAEKI